MARVYGEAEDGNSTLIIGMGRTGKTGYGIERLRASERPIKIMIAPRVTNKTLMEKMDRIDWPVSSADELMEAYNQAQEFDDATDVFLILILEKIKGNPSIFKILRDPRFKGAAICADELAILTLDTDDWNEMDVFIRCVGQNDQEFIGITHKIRNDISRAVPMNCQEILYIGRLMDEEEVDAVWSVSSLKSQMDKKQFTEKLGSQEEKYNWWDAKPNKKVITKIYG